MFDYGAEAMGGVTEDVVGGFGVGVVEYLVHSGGCCHDFFRGVFSISLMSRFGLNFWPVILMW